jgi:hypothetical protein
MWKRIDSQEVGLEAAIFQRKRNSSLVEWVCAENVTGLKSNTEASGFIKIRLCKAVGERRSGNEG